MPSNVQVKWGRVMEAVVTASYYRILGQSSIHAPPEELFQYIWDEVKSPTQFGGQARWLRDPEGTLTGFGVLEWKDIALSDLGPNGPVVNIIAWGAEGRYNTIFSREGWWQLYLARGALEQQLGLPRGSLKTAIDQPFAGEAPALKPVPAPPIGGLIEAGPFLGAIRRRWRFDEDIPQPPSETAALIQV